MKLKSTARVAVALSVAVAATLSGCSSSATTGGPTTITLWNGFAGTENAALTKLIDQYWTPSHPDIKVTVQGEKTPEAMLTAMTGGDSPDVVIAASSETPTLWYHSGAIEDLTPLANSMGSDLTDDVVDAALQWGKTGDTTFALPFVDYNWGIFYNKTMFADAGLDPDRPPTTIDELTADAKALTTISTDGSIEQLGWLPVSNEGSAIALSMAFGAKFVDADGQPTIDDPGIEKALTWDSQLAASFGSDKVQAFTSGFTQGDNPFALGKAAIYIEGSWGASMLKDSGIDFGYASIPASDPAFADSNPVGTNPIVIPKATQHKDAAEEFARFLATDPDLSGAFSAAISNVPQVKSVLDTFSTDPATVFFAKLTDSPNARAWAPVPYAQEYINQILDVIGRIYSAGDDVTATLKDAETALKNTASQY